MKHSEHSSSASYPGHVKNGVVVLDIQVPLPEGQPVRVEPVAQRTLDQERADRVRQLQYLFSEWTEEDGKLPDEEADRLHAGLEEGRGLGFRAPTVD
jgi:hypothetical protein